MKVAVSGSHRTGKTTLIDALAGSLPSFTTVDEPYYLLVEEGHVFADMPSIEDFELQLVRSISSVLESEEDCLFDRCPLDIFAYINAHDDYEGHDVDQRLPGLLDAMRRIDLIAFVPIEEPDRIASSGSDQRRLRRRVDEELREIVLDDRMEFGVPALEVTGTNSERARQILAYLEDL